MSVLRRLVVGSSSSSSPWMMKSALRSATPAAGSTFMPGWISHPWTSGKNNSNPGSIISRSFASKKHKRLLKFAKGFRGRAKNCYSIAVRRVQKSWQHAYKDRRRKRRNYKKVWIQRISAGVRQYSWNYSQFMKHLYGPGGKEHRDRDPHATSGIGPDSGIRLNRKILSELAMYEPMSFKAVVDVVQESTGVYKVPAFYSPEDGWDFDDQNQEDDYYYDHETSTWLPKQQQQES